MNISGELIDQFDELLNQLSPENLHCDGEISNAEADRKYTRLIKKWRALEKIVGRKVSEDEIWNAVYPM